MDIKKGKPGGLTAQLKNKLIQQALERRLKQAGLATDWATASGSVPERHAHADDDASHGGVSNGVTANSHTESGSQHGANTIKNGSGPFGTRPARARAKRKLGKPGDSVPEEFYRFHLMPGYQQLRILNEGGARMNLSSPFFKVHEGQGGNETRVGERTYINYASYDYLGMSSDLAVQEAAKAAIDRYGTSVSASRVVAGERPIHRELEQAIADVYDADAAVVFVSGHATNVSVIGQLFGPRDLVLHDELIHNSVLMGIKLSGAHRLPFAHNDWEALDEVLSRQRHEFERVLIVVEGLYGMDGDIPNLPRFIEVKKRHHAFLMVDEAHSFGVLGERGYGLREYFGLAGKDVDIWMGTFSKALAGCGGYIAGEAALVEHLKFLAPGFLYSVGMAPTLAAASLTALRRMQQEPQRVHDLQKRAAYFLQQARAAGVDTGFSMGMAVIPVITGSTVSALKLSEALFDAGINVLPILYPAVPEKAARLRFFMSCRHTIEQIDYTIATLKKVI